MPRRRVEEDYWRPLRLREPVRGEVVIQASTAPLAEKIIFRQLIGFATADVIVGRAGRKSLELTPFIDLKRSIDADLSAAMGADVGTCKDRIGFGTSRMSRRRPDAQAS